MNPRERFLSACRRQPVDRHPVWLMRQAGRYLPEYQELREKYDFLTICKRPDLILEASLQPWRRFGMDAVIIFSDILLPLHAMGARLTFEDGVGPRFESTVRTEKEIEKLEIPRARISFSYILEAIQNVRHEIKDNAALLGFVGAPWTLAAYLIEGGSGDFKAALNIMRESPGILSKLMDKITTAVTHLAVEQVRAGCDAIQIFDTWGGLLGPAQYRELALPHLKKISDEIRKAAAPAIIFIKKSSSLLEEMVDSGADVISIGTDLDLKDAISRVKDRRAVQGNLNPEILLRSASTVERETQKLLDVAGNRPGYIANLGHGVLPNTPVESVGAFVETVKRNAIA